MPDHINLNIFKGIFIGCLLTFSIKVNGQTNDMVLVKGGSFIPLYGSDSLLVTVQDFEMDIYPVTNADFQKFVINHPEWKKSRVKRIFADGNYLYNWNTDTSFGEHNSISPVTNVSWFTAKKYCESKGKRLPLMDEWEYAAMSDEHRKDARKDSLYNQYILDWYETPKTFEHQVGGTFKNFWGIYDMHELVWEWTLDFNSVLISGESRSDVDLDRNLFCAGGAVGATDLMNYAAFMRYAFRGSLKANYAVKNLGFRCAKELK